MAKVKETIILIMAITAIVSGRVKVSVKDGVMKINEEVNCTIQYNDHEFTEEGPKVIDGLFYGLIEYQCGHDKGRIISEVRCKQCGLFCNHNELIEGCESKFFTMLLGCVVGFTVSVIAIVLSFKHIGKGLDKLGYWWNYMKAKRMDKREGRRVRKLTERTEGPVRYKFKPLPAMSLEGEKKTYARREKMVKTSGRPGVATSILLVTIIGAVYGCDNTLFIKSNGKVCDSVKCVDSSMYNMPIATGMNVCFKDYSGDIMKISVDRSVIKTQYSLMYYTSNYSIMATSHYRCKGAGGCWENACGPTTEHEALKDDLISPIARYGCQSGTLGCDTWCAYKTACTWYKWALMPGTEKVQVYEKMRSFWEITIKVSYRNTTMRYKMNVNNPRVNLNGIMDGMPIYITGVESEKIYEHNGLILYRNGAYLMKVAGINMPETDIIGDFQIALEGGTHTYNEHEVYCTVESCKVYCRAPESKLARVIRSLDKYPRVAYTMQDSQYMLETSRPVDTLANILIGNVDLKNLHVEKAQCKIEQVGTYSCTGCTTDPYAILQAHNIKSEGILPFESNCTFTKDYLSCSPEPYKLVLSTFKKNCYIYIPSLNDTVYLDFQFTFKGALDPSKPIYNVESDIALLKGLVTNESFVNSLITTFSFFGIMSIVMSMTLRIIRAVEIRRIDREMVEFSSPVASKA